jgi:putative salt-induced outer membrane protein YdiY
LASRLSLLFPWRHRGTRTRAESRIDAHLNAGLTLQNGAAAAQAIAFNARRGDATRCYSDRVNASARQDGAIGGHGSAPHARRRSARHSMKKGKLMQVSSFARALLAFSFCVAFSTAHADSLQLKNGDRLTGKIIRKDDNTVVLKTSYAGEVKVNWSDVTQAQTDKPLRVMLSDDSIVNATLLNADTGTVKFKSDDMIESVPIALSKVKYINPSPEVSGQGVALSGHVNIGLISASGNSRTKSFHLDGEWVARTRDDRFTADATINRASDAGTLTDFNNRGDLKYDYFLSKKWYLYSNTSAENDQFKDLKLRTTLGGGSGYQIFELPGLNLYVEGGLNYVNNDYIAKADDHYPSTRWAIKYDQMLLNNLTAFHQQEGIVSLQSNGDILIRTKTGFRFPLTKQLIGTIQYNVDWDRLPPPGTMTTDRTLLFNLGYRW